MMGTIKYESKALVTCSDCGLVSSMDTTIYRGNIIAFLGARDGKLSKVLLCADTLVHDIDMIMISYYIVLKLRISIT